MNTLENLVTEIMRSVDHDRRFIIGIDGLSRSGKTTFVKKFSAMLEEKGLQNITIHLDDHIVERTKRYATGEEEWLEYYSLQWDVDLLKESLFGNLVHSNEMLLPFYDEMLDRTMLKKLDLTGMKIVIVEGVFLQREEWKKYLDYTVFIDCPRNVRFARESLQTQQNIKKFKNRYWKAEDYYLERVKPVEKADNVILYHQLINE